MDFKRFLISIFLFINCLQVHSKNFVLESVNNIIVDSSTIDSSSYLYTSFVIKNQAKSSINIIVKRIENNVPSGWYGCFCKPQCLKDTNEIIFFSIPFQGKETLAYGFSLNKGISGKGKVKIVISEDKNPNQSDTLEIFAEKVTPVNGTSENLIIPNLEIFPNPLTGNILSIRAQDGFKGINFSIYDSHLRIVHTGSLHRSGELNLINLNEMQNGIYFFILNGDKRNFVKSFIVN